MSGLTAVDYRYHRYRGWPRVPYETESSARRVVTKWRRSYRTIGWELLIQPCGSHWHIVSRPIASARKQPRHQWRRALTTTAGLIRALQHPARGDGSAEEVE